MKEGFVIRFLIVALPAGLLLSGILAVLNTHFDEEKDSVDPNEKIRLEAAAINRKPVHAADLATSLEILSGRIGERHVRLPEKLESAAVWIESTLGPGNIGYVVERQTFEVNGLRVRNLVAELPGKERREEIVVVAAHYDTIPGSPGANSSGSGIAALVSLARAFAGDPQTRTVRFVALVNEASPDETAVSRGSQQYLTESRAKEERIVAMINLRSLGYYSTAAGSQQTPTGAKTDVFGTVGNFFALIGEHEDRFAIESAKIAFASASPVPLVSRIDSGPIGEELRLVAGTFRKAGVPSVLATDTASLRYPHHDRPTDSPGRLDITQLESVTTGLKAVLDSWANP